LTTFLKTKNRILIVEFISKSDEMRMFEVYHRISPEMFCLQENQLDAVQVEHFYSNNNLDTKQKTIVFSSFAKSKILL